jgi:mannan polymerase complexes MNN9 subunit
MFSASRTLRRFNPITLFLAALLLVSFVIFVFSDGDSQSAPKRLHNLQKAAGHYLSPPSLPFRRPLKDSSSSGDDKERAAPPVVHYHMNNLTTTQDPIGNRETVLILTPLAKFYQGYWDNIISLEYPHDLISLGFIIPKGREGNAANAALQDQIQKTQQGPREKRFASITVLRQDTEDPLQNQSEHERHKLENQKARRAAMAKARNSLLFTTMGPTTSWVLWLDGDIIETPHTLIQDLAAHDKPIIAPNCFQRYFNQEKNAMDRREYDFNNWIDSEAAQELAKTIGADDVLFEGYASMPTYRTLMAYLPGQNSDDPRFEVELDGVGGATLLVKAEVHRDGAMFPPFPFYHLIETEGFCKMAKRLGWKSYGLPNYFVSCSALTTRL